MRLKLICVSTLFTLAFGGYIGYTTNYTETAQASELVIPRFTDIPRNNGFNLDINLNKNTITCNDSPEQNIQVKIQKKDSIIYKYKTLIRNKVMPKVYVIRETKPVKAKPSSCIDVLKSYTDNQQVEKINLRRN